MHSSLVIARRLLELAQDAGKQLTPMQLLKLVYICHGFHLAHYGRPLTKDIAEAWKYGPVIPELYAAISKFRSNPVLDINVPRSQESEIDPQEDNLIEAVYEKYQDLTGMQLSSLTHAKDTPWSQTYGQGFEDISNDLIQEHYREMLTA